MWVNFYKNFNSKKNRGVKKNDEKNISSFNGNDDVTDRYDTISKRTGSNEL